MAEFRDLFVAEILNDKFWCEYYEKEPHLFTSSDFPHGLEMISKLVNVVCFNLIYIILFRMNTLT